ncbi:hypothetical protein Hanom_Chr17g01555751 [Helianthus anomalus]
MRERERDREGTTSRAKSSRSPPYSSHNNDGRQRVRVRTAQRLGFHGINR